MLSKTPFFQLEFSRFLGKLAWRTAKGSTTISTSTSSDVISRADVSSKAHLENPTETKTEQTSVKTTRATAASWAWIRVSFRVEVVVSVLDPSVQDARHTPCAEAGPAFATTETITPFTTVGTHGEVFGVAVAAWGDGHDLDWDGLGLDVVRHVV